jgi:GGDEF domain-containing protein
VALIGEAPADFFDSLPNIDHVAPDPALLVARMVPLVRMHAFEARLKRMLKSLDADGMFDPRTGLLTQEAFAQGLTRAIDEAADRSQPLSLARIGLGTMADERASLDGARLLTRLTRIIDFACRDEDGSLVVAFTQTDLSCAHVVARRMAGVLKNMVTAQRGVAPAADVTLATLKDGDTLDSLMRRVVGRQPVAAG